MKEGRKGGERERYEGREKGREGERFKRWFLSYTSAHIPTISPHLRLNPGNSLLFQLFFHQSHLSYELEGNGC